MAIRWRDRGLSILYKYRPLESKPPGQIDPYTLRIIQNGEIFLAAPSSFNDPFDCRLRVSATATLSQIEKYFLLRGVPAPIVQQNIDLIRNGTRRPQDYVPSNLKAVSDLNRVYCLSRESQNVLLWSHYAEDHTGVCIGISVCRHMRSLCIRLEPRHIAPLGPHLAGELLPAVRVRYRRKIPKPYNIFTGNHDQLKPFVLTKSKAWKYEREYRMIVPKSKVLVNPAILQHGQIDVVIFGCNCSASLQSQLLNVIRASPFVSPAAKILKCNLDRSRYQLYLTPV